MEINSVPNSKEVRILQEWKTIFWLHIPVQNLNKYEQRVGTNQDGWCELHASKEYCLRKTNANKAGGAE